ncbi:MAG: DUF2948 family protein [Pseudomonadota bacterium]
MSEDARFEDGDEAPLRVRAFDGEDLQVVSALVQDAVFPITEVRWQRSARRFAILLNRFRWEREGVFGPERVQAVLAIEDAVHVASQGIDRAAEDLVLSVLSIAFEAGEDGGGQIVLTLAGDGALSVVVEALEVTLTDVTRPYSAPSGKTPSHPD